MSKKQQALYCGNAWCGERLPGPLGTPGVSLARADGKTLLCSDCGTREAIANWMAVQEREHAKRNNRQKRKV